jgi:mono/diheme cytochrome c family protein
VGAIRHGVRPDGTALLVMPSAEYGSIGPDDLGALVSWIKSMPSVDSEPLKQRVGPLGRALYLAGDVPLLAAEVVDNDDLPFGQPEVGVTTEYGAYIASSCVGCHSLDYAGGPIPGMRPEFPAAGNLTPGIDTGIGTWTEADFMSFFATGVRPDGRQVEPQFMPWLPLGQAMADVEKQAVWMFLRSLPPMPMGGG